MIINTGQRTDIPAFYSKWFMNRIKEGYVLVRNPYYPNLVTKFILDPSVVDVIGFCSKNPNPMLRYLDDLKDYNLFWHVTITTYGNDIEPNVPSIDSVINDFIYLSNRLGKNSVVWRYTPIIVDEKYSVDKHIETFRYIASKLYNYTNTVIFGFLDLYDKLVTNKPELKDASDNDKIKLSQELLKICKEYNLSLRLCSKEKWLKDYGIDVNGCMRIEDYEAAINKNLIIKDKMEARKGYCSCYLSNDIGAYNSCLHLCKYCYANGKDETIIKNNSLHDPNSAFLIGNSKKDDIIKEAKQTSYIDDRLTLF
ncbi:MAG: DUF1848 domain-containing protein [bacterium]|nr:DUF1848 domain-containing protein [bacterium]